LGLEIGGNITKSSGFYGVNTTFAGSLALLPIDIAKYKTTTKLRKFTNSDKDRSLLNKVRKKLNREIKQLKKEQKSLLNIENPTDDEKSMLEDLNKKLEQLNEVNDMLNENIKEDTKKENE